MPRPMTELESQAFLAEPRVGVLSVASDDDRSPLTVRPDRWLTADFADDAG